MKNIKRIAVTVAVAVVLVGGAVKTAGSTEMKQYDKYIKRCAELQQTSYEFDEWKTLVKLGKIKK